ncbi:MAG TPA: hypothetical protein VLE21_05155, partial [Candidatus Nitrosocosmicus sp.]|nr:hypothetical protein [Candidatus Nitrosocosmicus sp.]
MTVMALSRKLNSLVRQGNGSVEVVFDTCGHCFDQCAVEVKSANYERELSVLILTFDSQNTQYHYDTEEAR